MSARHFIVLALLWTGVGCVLLSAVALLRLRGTFMRLHALAPASVAGIPLIAAAIAVDQGLGRSAVKTLFIGLLFTAGGTVTTIAIGRASHASDQAERVEGDKP